MEERECPKCGEILVGESVGKVNRPLSFWCDECEIDIDEYNLKQEERECMEHDKQKEDRNYYPDHQELKDEERRYEEKYGT